MKSVTIIDTFGFFLRAYFALPKLTSSDGSPTGLLTGFINFIHKLQKELSTDYLIFALDSKSSFRKEIYPEYKANRKESAKDLITQLEIAISWIEKMGFGTLMVDGFEADDIISSVTKLAKENFNVRIISNDKDLYQLIDKDRVLVYDWVKKSLIDEQKCIEKFGIKPQNFIDFQAILGDSSDNVPGVKGIGQKGASKLINEWETLENIYQNIDSITPARTKKLLIDGKESAFLSKELVRLRDNIFNDFDFEKFKLEDRNYLENLRDDFERFEMRQALHLIGQKSVTKKSNIKFETILLNQKEKLFEVIDNIPKDAIVSFDTETDSLDTKSANLVGFSFAFEDDKAYYVPVAHNYLGVAKQIDLEDAKEAIRRVFEHNIIGQNLKFDLALIYNLFGFEKKIPKADTMILAWLLDSGSKVGLDFLANRYLDYEMKAYKDVVKKGENFSSVDLESASFYASEDAIITLKLYLKFMEIFEQRGLHKLQKEADEVEYPFINVLIMMEQEGIKVDMKFLEELQKEFSEIISTLTQEIHELAGGQFNIKSPKQLGEILFKRLGLKSGKRTKSGYSTNEMTLQKIKSEHPIIEKILHYREIQKLLSTYIKPLIKLAKSDKNSRIYTTFLQTGTATGRLSSKEPNLQNIPVRSELGRKIRRAFIAKDGYKLLSIDYSQIELRLLAHFSQDETLIEAFKRGEDIHLATAIKLFGLEEAERKRDFAKSINFGLLYGMGARKLSNELNISSKDAKEIIQSYFEAFPTIKDYIQKVQDDVKQRGFIETLLGRRRYFDYQNASDREKAGILRESVNTLFQGSASDLIKLAMLKIDTQIRQKNIDAKMLLQIHDELIFEVKDSIVQEVGEEFREIMESIYPLNLPLKCSINIADSWDKLK